MLPTVRSMIGASGCHPAPGIDLTKPDVDSVPERTVMRFGDIQAYREERNIAVPRRNKPSEIAFASMALLLAGIWSTSSIAVAEDSIAAPNSMPSDEWLESNDVRIRSIILDKRGIFDPNKPGENKSLFRLANKLHIDTRGSTITSQLLFGSGDVFSRRMLEESERILRKNRYLYDATIYPIDYANGQVDIVVTTRDVWTLHMGASVSRSGGANDSNVKFEETNLLGLGSKLSLDLSSDVDRNSTILEFSDANLGGDRMSLSLQLANSSDGDTTALTIERPFYALDTRWAGGFEVMQDDHLDRIYDLGEVASGFQHESSYGRVYAGISKGLTNGWVSRWSTGFVLDEQRFSPGDYVLPDSLLLMDRKLVYPFVSYELIEDQYRTTKNTDQIDRTEDVNLGTHLNAEVGWSARGFGADRDALVFDVRGGTGFGSPEQTMLQLDGSVNGWLQDGNATNTRLELNARYHHRISDHRLLFASASIIETMHPELDNYVDLGGDVGLRGYPLRYQVGQDSALFTLEQRYFTDWYPFHLFRVGGAVFADAGRTWGSNQLGRASDGWLTDVGLGLRLGSTRGGSGRVLHIDLAFPLNGDAAIDNVQLQVGTRRSF